MNIHHRIYVRGGELLSVPASWFVLTGSAKGAVQATVLMVSVSAVDTVGSVCSTVWSGRRVERLLFSPWRSELIALPRPGSRLSTPTPGGSFACAGAAVLVLATMVLWVKLLPPLPQVTIALPLVLLLVVSATFNYLPWPGSDGHRWIQSTDDAWFHVIVALPVGAVAVYELIDGTHIALAMLPLWIVLGSLLRRHREPTSITDYR